MESQWQFNSRVLLVDYKFSEYLQVTIAIVTERELYMFDSINLFNDSLKGSTQVMKVIQFTYRSVHTKLFLRRKRLELNAFKILDGTILS